MNCKHCDTPTSKDILNLKEGLCEYCYDNVCFCKRCKRKISYENSEKNGNYCPICLEKEVISEFARKRILNLVGLLNKVLICFLMMSITFILLAAFHKNEFTWLDVNFELKNCWIVYVLLSISHWFIARLLNQSVESATKNARDSYNKLILEISSSDNLFFIGFIPKISWQHKKKLIKTDTNLLLYCLTFFLSFIAVLMANPSLKSGFLATFLVWINVMISTTWVVNLSICDRPGSDLKY